MRPWAVAALATFALAVPQPGAQERRSIPPKDANHPLPELISGYEFTPLKIRALQDDDFDNPGFAWVSKGERLWGEVEGAAQKSCASCHNNAMETMRGVAAAYPKYQEGPNAVLNIEQRINLCRQEKMQASPWPYGSEQLLGMTAYVKLQSRGLPVDVKTDGPAQATFELGQKLYGSRFGQLGMSCGMCHNDHYSAYYRASILSQGHSNGYPSFHAKTQAFIPLHQRFQACFSEMRADPFELGSPEFVALELYLAWRGKGLPIETPAVRR
jgi:L-cysteine S-thiosulfotransferase